MSHKFQHNTSHVHISHTRYYQFKTANKSLNQPQLYICSYVLHMNMERAKVAQVADFLINIL
jgi:hypothetical protein